ncbi:hypothetical protein [Fodinicola feengrottensis]|uniref:Uncharacterized protein n=1 Tax=Fodinicola feengrottensis TaxID=435914 RepID=A0ABN2H769_9ACTN|nr:hypothetical protein [Fodinicola feengrottensis]
MTFEQSNVTLAAGIFYRAAGGSGAAESLAGGGAGESVAGGGAGESEVDGGGGEAGGHGLPGADGGALTGGALTGGAETGGALTGGALTGGTLSGGAGGALTGGADGSSLSRSLGIADAGVLSVGAGAAVSVGGGTGQGWHAPGGGQGSYAAPARDIPAPTSAASTTDAPATTVMDVTILGHRFRSVPSIGPPWFSVWIRRPPHAQNTLTAAHSHILDQVSVPLVPISGKLSLSH